MKSSFESVLLCLLLAASAQAQDQTPGQITNQTAPATVAPPQAPAAQAPTPQAPVPAAPTSPVPTSPVPAQTGTAPAPGTLALPREVSSPVNTGSGLSFEPMYWFTKGTPELRAGGAHTTTAAGNLDFNAPAKNAYSARVNIPVSKNATLRVSYYQTKSSGVTIASRDLNLFNQAVAAGDILPTQYTVEDYKLSYDYLTYFWKRGSSELRLKTLYEVQRISISNEADDIQVDSTGAVLNVNTIIGPTSVFLPAFGLGLEHTLSRHFRWEARGSGFGLPRRGDIADAEAQIAVRFGHFELLGGERFVHYKTNPRAAQYTVGNLYGPYVSLRYYWKKR